MRTDGLSAADAGKAERVAQANEGRESRRSRQADPQPAPEKAGSDTVTISDDARERLAAKQLEDEAAQRR